MKPFLYGAIALLCSCVDHTYDLKKGVAMDVKIEGNHLSLPIGSLRPILLDSLIGADDMEMISQMNGVYSISMVDSIAPIDLKDKISEIKFTMPTITEKADFDFDNVVLENPHLDESTSKIKLDMPMVSISDLNNQLPNLSENRRIGLVTDDLKQSFEQAKALALMQGKDAITLPIKDYTVEANGQGIPFSFEYTIPKEIATIDKIFFANRDEGEDATSGSLIEFRVVHPSLIAGVERTVKFDVNFPEMFVISLVDNSDNSYKLHNKNQLTFTKTILANEDEEETTLRFYLDEMEVSDAIDLNNLLAIDEDLQYSISYGLNGTLVIPVETSISDLGYDVKMDAELGCRDAIGTTNPISIELDNLDEGFSFEARFEGLEDINSIDYVEFDENETKIHISAEMNGDFKPFHFAEDCYVLLELPRDFVINKEKSVLPQYVEYIEEDENGEHALKIYDIDALSESDWYLALDRININKKVEGGRLDVIGNAKVLTGVNGLTFDSAPISFSKVLPKLQEKEIIFTMYAMDLVIQNVQMHTDKIRSAVIDTVQFELNEFVGNNVGIEEIYSVEFPNPVPMNLKLRLENLEIVDTHVGLLLDVVLPPFLSLTSTSNSETVTIDDGVLHISYDYHTKGEPLEISLLLTALDFSMLEGGCIAPEIMSNGDTYLKYTTDIVFSGEAVIDSTTAGIDALNQQFAINVELTAGEVAVRKFAGKYNGIIEPVETTIELELGGMLENILTNEDNTIKLACPQIQVGLENTVNVPIYIDIEIVGKDADGKEITKLVKRDVPINPALYDEVTGVIAPDSTKLMITNKMGNVPMGYTPVIIEELSDLLNVLPKTIDFVIYPRVRTDVVHHIDLYQPLTFSADYKVVVPFEFDELDFNYSDTIVGLSGSLGEMLEMFSEVEVGLNMDVRNSLPLSLELVATPLDVNGNPIASIEISEFEIPAGDGKSFNDTTTISNPVQFSIKSKTGDISVFDQLLFEIHAEGVTTTAGGVALRGNQGLKIENIVIEFIGDLELRLDE